MIQPVRFKKSRILALMAAAGSMGRFWRTKATTWSHVHPGRSMRSLLDMQALEELEELYMKESPLLSLPPELFQLQNLKVLSFSKTEFPTVPATLANLANLKVFVMDSGRLEVFPEGLRGITKCGGLLNPTTISWARQGKSEKLKERAQICVATLRQR